MGDASRLGDRAHVASIFGDAERRRYAQSSRSRLRNRSRTVVEWRRLPSVGFVLAKTNPHRLKPAPLKPKDILASRTKPIPISLELFRQMIFGRRLKWR